MQKKIFQKQMQLKINEKKLNLKYFRQFNTCSLLRLMFTVTDLLNLTFFIFIIIHNELKIWNLEILKRFSRILMYRCLIDVFSISPLKHLLAVPLGVWLPIDISIPNRCFKVLPWRRKVLHNLWSYVTYLKCLLKYINCLHFLYLKPHTTSACETFLERNDWASEWSTTINLWNVYRFQR